MARAKSLLVAGPDLVRRLRAEKIRSMRVTSISIESPERILASDNIDSSSDRYRMVLVITTLDFMILSAWRMSILGRRCWIARRSSFDRAG